MSRKKFSEPEGGVPTQKELQAYTAALPLVPTIKNDTAYARVIEDYKHIGKVSKELAAKKDSVLKPMKEAVKNLNALFAPYETKIKQVEAAYKDELNRFISERETERAAKIAAIENDKRLKNPVTIQQKIHEAGEIVDNVFRVKVLLVTDSFAIPEEYYDLNEARVLAALKAGIVVPGAELVEEVRVRR